MIKRAAIYEAGEGPVQGVGLRKILHNYLEEQNLPGLAVNDPYTGTVKINLPDSYKSRHSKILKELLKRVNTESGVDVSGVSFNEEEDKGDKWKKRKLTDKDIRKLRVLYNLQYMLSPLMNPNDVDIKPVSDFKTYLKDRYRLEDSNGALVGSVPDSAYKQLTGETAAYKKLLPENRIRTLEDVKKLAHESNWKEYEKYNLV
jgi:acylphosphatase